MSARDFAGIYDEQVWRVYGFFAYRLSSRADAEDLTQQTFEQALRAWRNYDESRASVATWLMVIARNLLADHFKSARVKRVGPADDEQLESVPASPDAVNIGLDPDLELALSELGARERELIALRFGGDLSGPEIADMTGLTVANVQQILSRSLRQMRASMDGSAIAQPRVRTG